jgi:hypothetical protein
MNRGPFEAFEAMATGSRFPHPSGSSLPQLHPKGIDHFSMGVLPSAQHPLACSITSMKQESHGMTVVTNSTMLATPREAGRLRQFGCWPGVENPGRPQRKSARHKAHFLAR